MYLQIPQYPFELRLGQWDVSKIEKQDIDTVYRFLNNENSGMHLFVFGTKRSGKTSISVGIATEFSIKHKACVYTTGIKLYSMFFEPDKKLLSVEENKWTWRTASLLIIDDINPGDTIKDDLVTPQCFQNFLDTFSRNDVNREIFRNNNIIWVLGDEVFNKKLWEKWQNILVEIGVEKNQILSINQQIIFFDLFFKIRVKCDYHKQS